MRVAMVSTPFVPVPPPGYGGTELVIGELVEGLAARGHEVTLFATGDSRVPVELRFLCPDASWPPCPYLEQAHAAWAFAQVLAEPRPFDLVHAHLPAALPLARFLKVPLVYTAHQPRIPTQRLLGDARLSCVAISANQRRCAPGLERATVIHHGLSSGRYPLGRGRGGHAAFLGRYAEEKGVHVALEVASRAGVPLRLGGRPHSSDLAYHHREVLPRLAGSQAADLGELGGSAKLRLLGEACALLFPIDWEEPFGLVMIEAMLCGTPVLAFGRGSVPELVEEGVTGFVCRDRAEMARRLRALAAGGFDRARCRTRALERFSAERMVEAYLALYLRLLQGRAWDVLPAAPSA